MYERCCMNRTMTFFLISIMDFDIDIEYILVIPVGKSIDIDFTLSIDRKAMVLESDTESMRSLSMKVSLKRFVVVVVARMRGDAYVIADNFLFSRRSKSPHKQFSNSFIVFALRDRYICSQCT